RNNSKSCSSASKPATHKPATRRSAAGGSHSCRWSFCRRLLGGNQRPESNDRNDRRRQHCFAENIFPSHHEVPFKTGDLKIQTFYRAVDFNSNSNNRSWRSISSTAVGVLETGAPCILHAHSNCSTSRRNCCI